MRLRLVILTLWLMCICAFTTLAQQPAAPAERPEATPKEDPENKPADNKRIELNLLGNTNNQAGESRRNENIQFNLIDNNALKELNLRIGVSATLVREFAAANSYFGAAFGNPPRSAQVMLPTLKKGWHGEARAGHLNSVFTARSFFQVGQVQPARENDYGFNFTSDQRNQFKLFVEGSQQKVRGMVNGNIIVPLPNERTPLTDDPATYAMVARMLAAYPKELPNRTDINQRALNTNAPQIINGHQAQARMNYDLTARQQLTAQYVFTAQNIDAFQLLAGQNPNTDTKSHVVRLAYSHNLSPNTLLNWTSSYERTSTLLEPEPNAVGPFVLIAGLSFLGPDGIIPLDRAQNVIRNNFAVRTTHEKHQLTFGGMLLRRQLNGTETDAHRGTFAFGSDFGKDAFTNLREGRPTQYLVSLGNVHRGFRQWETQFYAGDVWQVRPRLTVNGALRYQLMPTPREVNQLNRIPYGCDCNNVGPSVGFAYASSVIKSVLRGSYGIHFGEIFPVTYQQIRQTPPGNRKVVVNRPSLINPLAGNVSAVPTIYALDPALAAPYEHQYNLSWETALNSRVSLQLGYVGSRAHKLLSMRYDNRAHFRFGREHSTATINLRRFDTNIADIRWVMNGSRGFYDAGRATVNVRNWHGLTMDASYWFSKAIDLGSTYTNTAYDNDGRLGRSQSEYDVHADLKALSNFDQPHAFLWRTSYRWERVAHLPVNHLVNRVVNRALKDWTLSAIALFKTGTPFSVISGGDGPGFGNVDGTAGDRPNVLDPSVLGRTIGHPNTSKLMLPKSAFAFIDSETERGSLGRNTFRKGGIRNVNTSLARTWSFKHDLKITFRAESNNVFNTPQFADPGVELLSPNFGAITNTLNEGRTFKFNLLIGW